MSESAAPDGPDPSPLCRGSGAWDLELARRALAGSGDARRELERRLTCVPRMLNHLNVRWGRPLRGHDVEDLSQDVLVALWRSLPSYAGLSALESWIFRTCHRALAARLRHLPPPTSALAAARGEPAADADPQVHDDVYQALDALEPRARQVVELKHFEGRTFEEIGSDLARSPNTIKTWYYQALEELRRLLARDRGREEA